MTVASEHSPLKSSAERLLSSLTGVVSARVVTDKAGEFVEIHVLATPEFHPKQIARNVESALNAGLGIEIDRRIISIAQVRQLAGPDPEPSGQPPRAGTGGGSESDSRDALTDEPEDGGRILFVGFETRYHAARHAICHVVLSRNGKDHSGQGEGSNTPQGRVQAAARATFAALADLDGTEDLGLEGASMVEAHGRTYVVVAGRALLGRSSLSLSGAAPVIKSPEEAAILASLQAANRRVELPC